MSAWRTEPSVSAENNVRGMRPRTKSVVVVASPPRAFWPDFAIVWVRCRIAPGLMRLPTTSPMASANVDIVRKYPSARPPILPTLAAFRTEPMPRTMVQKMIGEIIILMRLTKNVPNHFSWTAKAGKSRPTRTPRPTATSTAM